MPKHPAQVTWHTKGGLDDEEVSVLIIQSDDGIFFFDLLETSADNDAVNLIKKDQKVTLGMLQGINDEYYFVSADKNAKSDNINKLKILREETDKKCSYSIE